MRRALALFALVLSATAACAQVRVTASVDAQTVREDDQFSFVVEVTGADAGDVALPSPPTTQNLSARTAFPSMSTQGAGAGSRVAFTWMYRPLRPGEAQIGETVVRVNGVSYRTDGFRLRVVGSASGYVPPSSGPAQAAPSSTAPAARRGVRSRIGAGAVFVRADVSGGRVFAGEQVLVTYRLFLDERLAVRLLDTGTWDAPGFWREDLALARDARPGRIALGRTRYGLHVLARAAVFPTRAGALTVGAFRTAARVTLPVGTLPRFEDRPLASDASPVFVRPLPPGAPPAFTGAVGRFRFTAVLDGVNARVGEAVRLRAEVAGDGNLALVPAPAFALPDSLFDAFPPDEDLRLDRDGPRLQGVKAFTYAFVPRRAGRLAVPPVVFAYFDPRRGRYVTMVAGGGVLDIAEAAAASGGAEADTLEASEPEASPVAAFTRTSNARAFGLAALLTLAALLLLTMAWRLRRAGRSSPPAPAAPHPTPRAAPASAEPVPVPRAPEPVRAPPRRAPPHRADPPPLASALADAEAQFARGEAPAGYRALARAVNAALERRLGRAPSALPRRALADALAGAGVPEPTRASTLALLDRLDAARYAPGTVAPDASDTDVAAARAVIAALGP